MSDQTTAPAVSTDPDDDPRFTRNEMISVILLGLAATLTAVTAYLSGLAGGEEAEAFTNSNLALSDANFFFNQASQSRVEDGQLFVAWLESNQSGQDPAFIEGLMTANLQESIAYWNDTPDAVTPFDEDGPYIALFVPEALEQQEASETALREADDHGAKEEKLELANVVFAMALFAAGIVSIFKRIPLQGALLTLGGVMTIVGGVVLATAL